MRILAKVILSIALQSIPCLRLHAIQDPIRISEEEAIIQTQVNAEPVTSVYAGTAVADLVIGLDGGVESVRIIKSNPAHSNSATAAFGQWRFSPVRRNGAAVRAVVTMSIAVPDQYSLPEELTSIAAYTLLRQCRRLVDAKHAEAVSACTNAVRAADTLPPNALLEKSGLHAYLGHALFMRNEPQRALAEYLQALALVERAVKPSEAELAYALRDVARAQFLVGQINEADSAFSRSTLVLEAAIAALPSHKALYESHLQVILRNHALVKRAKGDHAGADALEKKAAPLARQ